MNIPFPQPSPSVPLLGQNQDQMFQFIIQVTPELKEKLLTYVKKTGLTYQQVLNLLLELGIADINIIIDMQNQVSENVLHDIESDVQKN